MSDTGGAKSCGCDTTINHECDRHCIDRLERDLQRAEQDRADMRAKLRSIEFEARLGYMRFNGPARDHFRAIFGQAKGYQDGATNDSGGVGGAESSAVSTSSSSLT